MSPELDKDIKRVMRARQKPELPPQVDDLFFERLHDRIMAEVDKTEVEPKSPWEGLGRVMRLQWKGWLVSGGSLMMILAAAMHTPNLVKSYLDESHVVQVVRNEEGFIDATMNSTQQFADTVISYQSEDDFFVDVAERSFHDLSKEHFREIMGEARP